MQILEKLEEVLSTGDEEVRTWFLIRNNYLPFLLSFTYILMAMLGPRFMKNRKPFNLRKTMIFFNFCVVFTYIIALIYVVTYLPTIPWEVFCRGTAVVKGDTTYLLATVAWSIYLLKYVEFLDTLFFILRKKENLVSFLHVMHHAVVPILGWVIFRTEKGAIQTIPVMLNGLVHIIMYSYYGLAAMGPKVRKYLWWKKYLTQLQMVQFLLVIFFVLVIVPISGCSIVTVSYLMDIIFGPLFLYLFYRFYKTTFKATKNKVN